MKKIVLIALVGILTLPLCGCVRRYVIKQSNGSQIATKSKPHLKNGYYYYKDLSGREAVVAAGRVVEISPASMAKDESASQFAPKK